jgi:glycosyltransferase involved in cell wall biosynthesis
MAELCLASIQAQSLADVEMIVTDDSSAPTVRAVAAELARTDPRIRYVEGARTGNPVDNWNQGLDLARGRLAVVVHHDEVLLDEHFLARPAEVLSRHPERAVNAGHKLVGERTRSRFRAVSRVARAARAPPWTLYMANWIGPTASLVFPADLGLRFDRRLRWLVDVDFYARLWARTGPFLTDPAIAVASTTHAGQITAQLDVLAEHGRELALLARDAGAPLTSLQVRLIEASLDLRRALRALERGVGAGRLR